MKKVLFAHAIASAAAAVSFSASAASNPASDEYIGAAIGYAEQRLDIEGRSLSDKDTGVKLSAGYRFLPRFAVEVGYASFGEGVISGNGARVTANPKSYYVALTGSVFAKGPFEVFGKIGVANTATEITANYRGLSEMDDQKETTPLIGVGGAYALSDEIFAVAEYEHFGKVVKAEGAKLNAHILSVGLRIRF